MDVCLRQIADGLAWQFKRYENEQSVVDRRAYAAAEEQAALAVAGFGVVLGPFRLGSSEDGEVDKARRALAQAKT